MNRRRIFGKTTLSGEPRSRKNEKGAAMVEFAIVLPLLLILTFGIVEFGLVLYNQQVITNASREGARAGILARPTRWTATEIESRVLEYCQSYLKTFGVDNDPVVTSDPDPDATYEDYLTVSVAYNYTFLVLPALLPKDWETITLTARTIMKYE